MSESLTQSDHTCSEIGPGRKSRTTPRRLSSRASARARQELQQGLPRRQNRQLSMASLKRSRCASPVRGESSELVGGPSPRKQRLDVRQQEKDDIVICEAISSSKCGFTPLSSCTTKMFKECQGAKPKGSPHRPACSFPSQTDALLNSKEMPQCLTQSLEPTRLVRRTLSISEAKSSAGKSSAGSFDDIEGFQDMRSEEKRSRGNSSSSSPPRPKFKLSSGLSSRGSTLGIPSLSSSRGSTTGVQRATAR